MQPNAENTTVDTPIVNKLREELGEIECKVLTGYTLADAMREGAKVSDQKQGGWIEGDQACALGAAFVAAKARGYIE